MTNKIRTVVTMEFDGDIARIGKSTIRQYIKDALNGWKGGFHPDDEMRALSKVSVEPLHLVTFASERGKAGAEARSRLLSPEQRRLIAQTAAKARWAKHNGEKNGKRKKKNR